MERKKLNKPKAPIEPKKLIIKQGKKEKKEIKNKKIAEILKLLDIEDSDEVKDEIIKEKKNPIKLMKRKKKKSLK